MDRWFPVANMSIGHVMWTLEYAETGLYSNFFVFLNTTGAILNMIGDVEVLINNLNLVIKYTHVFEKKF